MDLSLRFNAQAGGKRTSAASMAVVGSAEKVKSVNFQRLSPDKVKAGFDELRRISIRAGYRRSGRRLDVGHARIAMSTI